MAATEMPAQCLCHRGCDPEHGVTSCPHVNDGDEPHPSFGRAAVREFFAQF